MNVLIVVLEDFPGGDTRVRRQVAALRSVGNSVTVLCASAYSSDVEWLGCRIERTFTRREKAASLRRRLFEYFFFSIEILFRIASICRRDRIDIVQIANMPDFLVLGALPAKYFGRTPVILDMHDLMPELMASKSGGRGLFVKALKLQESVGFRFADQVMTVNGICAGILAKRHPGRQIKVIPNCPDPRTFKERGFFPWRHDDVVVIGYHGTVAPRFGVKTLVKSISQLREAGRNVRLEVWGGGDALEEVVQFSTELGIAEFVKFHGQTPVDEMVRGLMGIHISVVPYEADDYMGIAYSTKAFELALMGIPMVLSDLPGIREQFSSNAATFFRPGSAMDLSEKINCLLDDPSGAETLARAARVEVQRFDWNSVGNEYTGILSQIASSARAGAVRER